MEEEYNKNDNCVNSKTKRFLEKIPRRSLKTFAIFTAVIMLISIFNVGEMFYQIDIENDLPWEFTFGSPFGDQIRLKFVNAVNDTPLVVRFENVTMNTDLFLNDIKVGTLLADKINLYTFVVPKGTEPELIFFATNGLNLRVEKILHSEVMNVTNSHIFGNTFYKVGTIYVADFVFWSQEPKNVLLSSNGNLSYLAVTEFPANTPGISRYGIISEETETIILPAGTKSLRLISDGKVDYDMNLYSSSTPGVGIIDVVGNINGTETSKYIRTMSPVEQVYDFMFDCYDPVDTIAEGATTTYSIFVINTGNGIDTFNLSTESIWGATLSESNVTINQYEIAEVILTVTAPSGSAGQNASINVTCISLGNSSKQFNLTTVTYSKIPYYNFFMSYLPPINEGYPTQPIIHNIEINNNGTVQDTYDLEVFDCPANWTYYFMENPVVVDANETMTVPLILIPPINVTVGDYQVTVNGTSHNNSALTDFVITLNRISFFYGVDLSPDSQTKTDCFTQVLVNFTLIIQNSGNAPDTIFFQVQSSDYWELNDKNGFPVMSISLGPWEKDEIILRTITAPGFNQERTVQITGISENDTSITDTINCVSRTMFSDGTGSQNGTNWIVTIPTEPPGDVVIPVQQGDILNYSFTITNKGDLPDTYMFLLNGLYKNIDTAGSLIDYMGYLMFNLNPIHFPYIIAPDGWSDFSLNSQWTFTLDDDNINTTYFYGNINLNVNESKTMYLQIKVPPNAPLGEETKISIIASSMGIPTTFDSFRKTFIVTMPGVHHVVDDPNDDEDLAPKFPDINQDALFDMTVNEPIKTVRPGETINYSINVKNKDSIPVSLDFNIYHTPSSWITNLTNYSINLEPEESAEIFLSVTPPFFEPAAIDSDLDNLIDLDESRYNTSRLDPDTDDDMFWDGAEIDYWISQGLNDSTIEDYLNNSDVDEDGLVDGIEIMKWFTDPKLYDTDDDNANDLFEIESWQELFDKNGRESCLPLGDADMDDLINILDPHSDDDSAMDGSEFILHVYGPFYESNPTIFDTDADGVDDYTERMYHCQPNGSDTDNDGISDYDEIYIYLTSPTDRDSDNDGLLDGNEIILDNTTIEQNGPAGESIDIYRALENSGSLDYKLLEDVHCGYDKKTNATNPDTDNDGMLDGWELFYGHDPLSSDINYHYDTDGLKAIEEFYAQTNPLLDDTDGDGLNDSTEVAVIFRTDIEKGAVSNISYDQANTTNWIYLDMDHDGFGEKYYYNNTNDTATVKYDDEGNITEIYEGSSLLTNNSLILTLEDQTTIFINQSSFDVLYIWTPNADHGDWNQDGNLTGKCHKFVRTENNTSGKKPTSLILEDQELLVDSDDDGLINAVDKDSDNDGMPDWWEVLYGLNYTNSSDKIDDCDGDGLSNIDEFNTGTYPSDFPIDISIEEAMDFDSDGMVDGWEVEFKLDPKNNTGDEGPEGDPDGDGLNNLNESNLGGSPINSDSDADGLPDGWEVDFGLDPNDDRGVNGPSGDPDEDGLINLLEYQYYTWPNSSVNVTIQEARDFDGDGLPDGWEEKYGLNFTDDGSIYVDNGDQGDPDNDGIVNINEYGFDKPDNWELDDEGVYWDGTNPILADTDSDDLDDNEEDVNLNHSRDSNETDPRVDDTDGDGLIDGEEIIWGTNGLMDDTDGDGLTDGDEVYNFGTNPNDPDTDGDGISDGDEIRRMYRDDWTMVQHDSGHTGYSSSPAPDSYNLSWDFDVDVNDSIESVIACNGLVFVVTSNGKLYALFENTGEIIWENEVGSQVNASLAYSDGTIFVGSIDGKLYAFNEVNGTLLWNYSTGLRNYTTGEVIPGTERPVHSPTIYKNIILFGSDDGRLYALVANLPGDQVIGFDDDGDDNETQKRIDEEIYDLANNDNDYYIDLTGNGFSDDDPVILDNGTVPYKLDELDAVLKGSINGISFGTNMTSLIDEDCRRLVWSINLSSPIESSPAVINDIVYVCTTDGSLYAINFKSGKKMWEFVTEGAIKSSPSYANGKLYIGSTDGYVYALDPSTGREIWKAFIGAIELSLAVAFSTYFEMNLILVTAINKIFALRETNGSLVWSHFNWICSAPVVADGKVFVGTAIGGINAYDIDGIFDGVDGVQLNSADRLWNQMLTGEITPFGIVDGMLFVGSDKLYVIAGENAGLTIEKMTHSIIPNLDYERDFAVIISPHWGSGPPTNDDRIYVYGSDSTKIYNFTTTVNYNNVVGVSSGDIDGDDYDEIGIAETDPGSDGDDDIIFFEPGGTKKFTIHNVGELRDITVGNFDSDTAIEFAVVISPHWGSGPPTNDDRIYVYDNDKTKMYNFTTTVNYNNVVGISSGDIDGDGIDEIGIAETDPGSDGDDDIIFFEPSGTKKFTISNVGELRDITVGNFDSDTAIEFAVIISPHWGSGPPTNDDRIYVYDNDKTKIYNFTTTVNYNNVVGISSGDVDGDGIDEIGIVETDTGSDGDDDIIFFEPSGTKKFTIDNVGELRDITVGEFRNLAPTAAAGPDQSKHIAGSSVSFTFDGGGSSDPDGDIEYYWDFGDGTNSDWISSSTPSHDYTTLGSKTVTLTVRDAHETTDSDNLIITVTDIAPVAEAGPDQTDVHISGSSVTVTFSGASASDTDDATSTLTYLWNFADGQTLGGTGDPNNVQHTYSGYPELKQYAVQLQVTDPFGLSHTDTVYITITNEVPIADISSAKVGGVEKLVGSTADIHIGGSPVTVRFDAEPDSNDPDPEDSIEYQWYFSDDATWTSWDTTSWIDHDYSTKNTYTVSLKVRDGYHSISTPNMITVNIYNTQPNAIAAIDSGTPSPIRPNTPVTFDGSGSSDPDSEDNSPSILNFTWTFPYDLNGDGTISQGESVTLYEVDPTFTFSNTVLTDVYTVTLTVTDPYGEYDSDDVDVTVVNDRPVAIPAVDNTPPLRPGIPVHFNGGGSYDDNEDNVVTFNWYFSYFNKDGDTINVELSGQNPTYTFSDVSSETTVIGILNVKDCFGAANTNTNNTIEITIINNPPNNIKILQGNSITVHVGDTVNLQGDGQDPDGDNLNFSWEFGDGTPPTSPTLDNTTSHNYDSVGVFTVILKVEDPYDLYNTTIIRVIVTDNAPEILTCNYSPSEIFASITEVNFVADALDPDGDEVEYFWDFGDGSDRDWNGEPNASHTYDKSGLYVVTFTVIDKVGIPPQLSFGKSNSTTFVINVLKIPPTANAGPDQNVHVNELVFFNGTGSNDVDGDPLEYSWDINNDGVSDTLGATPTYRFKEIGVYEVNLTVTNVDGTSSWDICIIDIGPQFDIINITINETIMIDNDPIIGEEYQLLLSHGKGVEVVINLFNTWPSPGKIRIALYDGDISNGQYIGYGINTISGVSEGMITIDWNPSFGYHLLYAVVEYEDVEFNIPTVIMSTSFMVICLAENNHNSLDPLKFDSDGDHLLDGFNITIDDANPLYGILSEMGIAKAEGEGGEVTFLGEESLGTNPSKSDTDGDFLEDYLEMVIGTDPLNSDTDGDTLLDGIEFDIIKSSPLLIDSDYDGLWDGEEVLISFRTNAEGNINDNIILEYRENTWICVDIDNDFILDVFLFDSFEEPSNLTGGTELETRTPDGYVIYFNSTTGKLWINTTEDEYPVYIKSASDYAIKSQNPIFYFQINCQEVISDIRGAHSNDTDSDGLLDPFDTYSFIVDSDKDGLSDGEEIIYGTDPHNPDSDNDGVKDGDEVLNGSNPSSSSDNDKDGMPNWWEVLWGLNPNNASGSNGTYGDYDNDGLSNIIEFELGLSPSTDDTDTDGMPDSWEVEFGLNPRNHFDSNLDYDLDGLTNLQEYENSTNPIDWDADGDGIPDGWELIYNMDPDDPSDAESDCNDNDGLINLEEYLFGLDPTDWDSDSDGMPDGWEVYYGLNPRINDSLLDMDGDGSKNLAEYNYNKPVDWNEVNNGVWWNGTNPSSWDTDGDGMKDGWEIKFGLDPTDDGSTNVFNGPVGDPDNDGCFNIDEYRYGINPIFWDSDSDDMPDGWEVHHGLIPFVVDDIADRDQDILTNIDEFWWGTSDQSYWLTTNTFTLNGKTVTFLENGVYWNGTNPNERDTEGDGMDDGWEIRFGLDPLDDGSDTYRYNQTTRLYEVFGTGLVVNGLNGDPDQDFATNLEEYRYKIYPNESASEGITIDDAIDFESDGMPDGWEIAHGLIPYINDSDRDKDQDGLTNAFEQSIGTNPNSWDTDSDGLPDGWELTYGLDPLDDGLLLYQYNVSSRIYESMSGGLEINGPDGDVGLDNDFAINIDEYRWGICPIYWDSDDDKMPDGWELIHGLIPFYPDDSVDLDSDKLKNIEEFTYGLGIPIEVYNATLDGVYFDGLNPYDIDTDDDVMGDGWELWYNLDPKDDGEFLWVWNPVEKEFVKSSTPGIPDNGRDGDPDSDFALNWEEYIYGIHPNISEKFGVATIEDAQDSDNDTMMDGWEVAHDLMPSYDDRSDDRDGDTLQNYFEFQNGLNPNDRDTDGDGLPDNWELDYWLDPLDNGTDILEWTPETREYESIGTGLIKNGAIGDPDGDWALNWEEYSFITHPNINDVLILWDAMDSDHDGMPDGYEIRFRLNANLDDSNRDLDGDSLTNLYEYQWTMQGSWNFTVSGVWWNGTSPMNQDTESDKLPDDWEIKYDFDPLDDGINTWKYDWISRIYVIDATGAWINGPNGDPDDELSKKPENKKLSNLAEYENTTHPRKWDTDDDLIDDWWEIFYDTYPLTSNTYHDLDEDLLTNFEEYNREAMINGYLKTWEGQTYPRIQDTDEDGISDGAELKSYLPYMKTYSWNYYDSIGTVVPGSNSTQISPESNATYNFLLEEDDVYVYYYLIVYSKSSITPIARGGVTGETLLTLSSITGGYQSNYFLIKPENIDTSVGGYFVDIGNPDTSKVFELTSVVLYRQGGLDPLITDSDGDDLTDGEEISLDNGHLTFPFNHDTDFDLLTDGYEIEMGLNPNPEYSSRINTLLLNPYDSALTEEENIKLAEKEMEHYFEENFLILFMFIGTDPGDELRDSKGDPMLEQGFNEIIIPFGVLYKSQLYDAYSNTHLSGLPDNAVYYEKISNYSTKKVAHISFGIDAVDAVDLVKTLLKDDSNNDIANASDITFDMSSIFNSPESPNHVKVMTLITPNKETITDVSIVPELFEALYGIMEGRYFELLNDGNGTSLMTDDDNDGLCEWDETTYGLIDGDSSDTDFDGLIDGDEINIYRTSPIKNDTDNDLLWDGDEINPAEINLDGIPNVQRNDIWFKSDPALFDSDDDTINDSEEITVGDDTYITNPMKADTDDDGLNDNEEDFERAFSFKKRIRLSTVIFGIVIEIPAEIKDVRVGGGVISAAIKIGINHDKPEELSDFTLKYSSITETIENPYKNGNPNENTSILITHDITLSTETWPDSWNCTWRLYVEDNVQNDKKGTIEQFELTVVERCDPNNPDTDGDGLSDYEEVELGEYGYITDPTVTDTDLDTIEDGDEVKGTTPSGIRSDPTKKDTDMDGYNDNEDKDPLNDLILQVKVYKVKSCPKYDDDKMKIKIQMKGKTFVSKSLKQKKYISFYAAVNVNDKIGVDDSVNVFFDAWQADSGFWDFDGDTALSLDKTVSHQVMSNGKHGHTEGYAKGSGKRWGAVWYDIDTVILNKDKTILIVPKDGSKTYTAPKTGYLRYTGEQRFYVFILAVDEKYTETIIVPETIYYDSKLGSILLQGDAAKDDIPKDLRDIEFSNPDDSQASLSIAIRGVHAATVKSSQVSTIIKYLTMNKTGETPYEALDITLNVFTVGLPEDVLDIIPIVPPKISEQGKINEGFWASLAAALTDIAGFIWNGICAIGEFLASVATFVVNLGLAVLGAIFEAIVALAKILLEALNFLIDFIISIFMAVFDPILSPLFEAIENWCDELVEAINYASTIIQGIISGSNSIEELIPALGNIMLVLFAFDSILLLISQIIVTAMFVLIIMSLATGLGFIIGIVVDLIIGMIFGAIMESVLGALGLDLSLQGMIQGLIGLLGVKPEELDPTEGTRDSGDVALILSILAGILGFIQVMVVWFGPTNMKDRRENFEKVNKVKKQIKNRRGTPSEIKRKTRGKKKKLAKLEKKENELKKMIYATVASFISIFVSCVIAFILASVDNLWGVVLAELFAFIMSFAAVIIMYKAQKTFAKYQARKFHKGLFVVDGIILGLAGGALALDSARLISGEG